MKKGKVISKCPKNLYHLSETNHDGEWFYPRVPESICKEMGEDDRTKRVCFSSSICGAFFAISFYGDRKRLYVHIPCGIDSIVDAGKLYKPTEEQVWDSSVTKEYWIRKKVKVKCIEIVSIAYRASIYGTKFSLKWIKKFD